MSLVVVLFGKFCREAIGHQDVKISCNNLSIVFCYFQSVYGMLKFASFV